MTRAPVRFGYSSDITDYSVYDFSSQTWDVKGGRLIVLLEKPSAKLLTWLSSNATSVLFENQDIRQESETWILNTQPEISKGIIFVTDFTSNGISYTTLKLVMNAGRNDRAIYYGSTRVARGDSGFTFAEFSDTTNCTITFPHAPTGELLTWLQANGTKQ